ncbi:protease pro-enzyme activation domain-containing protein [Xanthomonas maliensis]|uniref:protease pro-enzyme activation domain-containing protein n=1 Tax=Xanthomonas maliensis TaxID=1321368 RepID=UPI0003B6EF74|nr:protease pro-enzyme activation domain-containing protein [Xanthomonas maliensis]KAB7769936.1 phage tail protein [Xanthomonas maliensis]
MQKRSGFHRVPLHLACLAILSGVAASAFAAPLTTPVTSQTAAPLAHLPAQLRSASKLGALAPSTTISLVMTLPLKDGAGAYDYAMRVSHPGDALYGHYLTPAEFAARFGARQDDIAAVKAFAQAHGIQVSSIGGAGSLITLKAPAATFAQHLGVTFNRYQRSDGQTFFSADRQPQLPSALVGHVGGIVGLNDAVRFAPLAIRAPTNPAARAAVAKDGATQATGHGPNGGLSPQDLRTAYGIPAQLAPGKLETLALFEQGGFLSSDIAAYVKQFGLPNVPVKVRNVNGYAGAVNSAGVAGEAALDIDMAIAVNPQLRQIQVYEEGDDPFPVALLASLGAMADDNTAQTVSISYGTDEEFLGDAALAAEGQVLTQMVAQGQGVYVSSGDQGAYGRSGSGLHVEDPGSQPLVTSVGGTTLFTGRTGGYGGEETWNLLGAGLGATGGGISSYWPLPDYQMIAGADGKPVSIAAANQGSSARRNVPDVAAVASPATPVAVYSELDGGWVNFGGTSVSAPIWAGFMSIADQAHQAAGLGRIGFANPFLYEDLSGTVSLDTNDVLDGSNGNANLFGGVAGFNAGQGYDNVTGLGSMLSSSLLVDSLLEVHDGSTPPPSLARGVHASTTATTSMVQWTGTNTATGYAIVAQDNTTGAFTSYAVTRGTRYTLGGLKPNTFYTMYVVALNKGGATVSSPAIVKTAKS